MGREAECICEWGTLSVRVKALLESNDLILRGAVRRTIHFSEMQQVRASQHKLIFGLEGDDVVLILGEAVASKWCQVITSPPVSLAKKMGITPESSIWRLGKASIDELETAMAVANQVGADKADLVIACVASAEALAEVLSQASGQLREGVPLWIVYPKGKGYAVSESLVLSKARESGLVDTKVASISPAYTGLRFSRRK